MQRPLTDRFTELEEREKQSQFSKSCGQCEIEQSTYQQGVVEAKKRRFVKQRIHPVSRRLPVAYTMGHYGHFSHCTATVITVLRGAHVSEMRFLRVCIPHCVNLCKIYCYIVINTRSSTMLHAVTNSIDDRTNKICFKKLS